MIGKTFSHYRIQEKLGEGGMGIVYRAQDTSLDRPVALKFLSPQALITEDSKTRFAREAKAAASLNHTNVATIFEYGEAEDPDSGQSQAYIAMEYVEGRTLSQKIEDNLASIEEAIKIAVSIGEGLSGAHKKNITHRDIKSDNIMVASDGMIKIMDFGLADVKGNTRVTKEGTTVGTIAYMAPEQARGENSDHRSDLWSYGVVLYELFTGTKPFKAAYEQALIYQILNESHEPATSLRPEIPEHVNHIIENLLQKDPEDRFQSMEDVLTELRSSADREVSVDDASRSAVGKVRQSIFRKFQPAWLGTGMILILALFIWYFWPASSNASIRSIAVLPFENITPDSDQEYFADGMTDQLITELSKIRSLRIASRISAMQFKGQYQSLKEVAKTLNVDGIITATVFRSGERMRLNASLVRASDEKNLWNDSYEREIEDVLNLTATLAQSIAGKISATLTPAEQKILSQKRPVNPEAFDLVARGNFLISSSYDEKSLEKALGLMDKAVQIDPEYAQAHIGVAWALTHLLSFNFRTGEEIFIQAKAAIDRAKELDPNNGLSYTLLGRLYMAQNNTDAAMAAYEKAVALSPNDGLVRTLYSWMLMAVGRFDEGVREAEIAVELDPLHMFARCNLMGWYYANHQYADAKAEASRILDLNPYWIPAIDMLRRIAARENRFDDAVAEGRKYWIMLDSLNVPENSSYQEFLQWEVDLMVRLASEGHFSPGLVALGYAEIGNNDKTVEWLQKAEINDDAVTLLLFYPEFNSIREDPRFEAFINQKHLPVNAYCTMEDFQKQTGKQ